MSRARDWADEPKTMADLEARLERLAPDNTAAFPLAIAKTRNEAGEPEWNVDIHVRIPRVTEYEITGVGPTLPEALRRAYLALNSEKRLRELSNAAYRQYGLSL